MVKLNTKFGEIELFRPNDFKFADATTNIAFKLAKELKKTPIEIANEIVNELRKFNIFERVENVNGFVNVFFSREFLIDEVFRILDEQFIKEKRNNNYLIEFVSANPTGPLNIVNARAGAIGDSLVRMGRFLGNDVIAEYYVNDEGSQILNLGYSILWRMGIAFHYKNNKIEIERKSSLNEPHIVYLENEIFDVGDDIYRGEYVVEIAKEVEDKVNEILKGFDLNASSKENAIYKINEVSYKIGKIASETILNNQIETLKKYGVNYDNIVKESFIRNSEYPKTTLSKLKNYLYFEDLNGERYELNENDSENLLNKNYYLKKYKDKALILKTTVFGDDKDRVLIRSNGEPTYFFWDIAYHYYKVQRIKDGYIINLLGPDHYGYIPRLKSALKMLGFENLNVLIVQQTNLIKDGMKLDMSKRKGQIYKMRELLEEVGVDGCRFFFLLRSPSTHLDFDINLAKTLSSENPVYYVQYAHARIESIKEHAKAVGINIDFSKNLLMKYNFENERKLIILSLYFEDVVKKAFYNLEPHLIIYYLLEIVENFHSYYQKYRVVDVENKEATISRIVILEALRKVINKALNLIGVSAPSKM